MARPQAFERELKLATAGLEPAAISALLAQAAKQALVEAQSQGVAAREFVRSVNGRVGAPEESVIAPGPIVYSFNWLPEIAAYALAFVEERSPVASGRFRRSWFVMVNGALVTDFEAVPLDAEIIITNDQPYARKIEVGHMKMRVPPGIVEDAQQAVMRRYGNIVKARKRFINLSGAYVLSGNQRSSSAAALAQWYGVPAEVIRGWKNEGRALGTVDLARRLAAQDRRSSTFRAGRELLAGRKDTARGQELRYPALVISHNF